MIFLLNDTFSWPSHSMVARAHLLFLPKDFSRLIGWHVVGAHAFFGKGLQLLEIVQFIGISAGQSVPSQAPLTSSITLSIFFFVSSHADLSASHFLQSSHFIE